MTVLDRLAWFVTLRDCHHGCAQVEKVRVTNYTRGFARGEIGIGGEFTPRDEFRDAACCTRGNTSSRGRRLSRLRDIELHEGNAHIGLNGQNRCVSAVVCVAPSAPLEMEKRGDNLFTQFQEEARVSPLFTDDDLYVTPFWDNADAVTRRREDPLPSFVSRTIGKIPKFTPKAAAAARKRKKVLGPTIPILKTKAVKPGPLQPRKVVLQWGSREVHRPSKDPLVANHQRTDLTSSPQYIPHDVFVQIIPFLRDMHNSGAL